AAPPPPASPSPLRSPGIAPRGLAPARGRCPPPPPGGCRRGPARAWPPPGRSPRWPRASPVQAPVLGDDAAQGVDVALLELRAALRQPLPIVPDRAQEPAGDAVALRRGQEYGQRRTLFQRRAPLVPLLHR